MRAAAPAPEVWSRVQRWCLLRDDGRFDRGRVRVLAPRQSQVGVHPGGQPGLVLGNEHYPFGAVVLLVEQQTGEGAAQYGAAAAPR